MIQVEMHADRATRLIRDMEAAGTRLQPLMADIGQELVNTTRRRFETSTSPEGEKWEPNSDVTVSRLIGDNMRKKDGSLNKRGEQRVAGKKPLIGETRSLSTEIHDAVGPATVTVGSNKVQAAMMQFGGKKADFPHLWGDIPARPFVGLSSADRHEVAELALEHLARAARL